MTLYATTDPRAIGQPINPNFGAANGATPAGAPTVQLPAGMPLLVAASLGLVPANALVASVNGVSVGATNTVGGDQVTVAELLSSGNGNQSNLGVSVGAVPAQTGENQEYTVGLTQPAMMANGPTPVNTDPLTIAPVPAGVPANSVTLVASGFGG